MTAKLPISRDAWSAVRSANKSSDRPWPRPWWIFVDERQLTEQKRRHRVGLVALLRLGQQSALDLRRTQCHIADDHPPSRRRR